MVCNLVVYWMCVCMYCGWVWVSVCVFVFWMCIICVDEFLSVNAVPPGGRRVINHLVSQYFACAT